MNDELLDVIAARLDAMPADFRPVELVNRDRARTAIEALTAAGYAVVKLPEPDWEDDVGQVYVTDSDIRVDTTGPTRYREIVTGFCRAESAMTFSPPSARWWALNLLAAANKSEEETKP